MTPLGLVIITIIVSCLLIGVDMALTSSLADYIGCYRHNSGLLDCSF